MKPFWPQTSKHTACSRWAQQCLMAHPTSRQWTDVPIASGVPSCNGTGGTAVPQCQWPLTQCPPIPCLVQSMCDWFIKLSLWRKFIHTQESKRHIVQYLLSHFPTLHWRNWNTGCYIGETTQSHTICTGENSVFHNSCMFAVHQYKFVSIMLQNFLQNVSLTFVLQLAICFYYLIPAVICLNNNAQ